MFKLSLVFCVAVVAVMCVPLFTAHSSGPVQSPDLPAGPIQAKAQTACLECHDARIITQQRLSRNAWTAEVDKMVRWGTVLDPKDRDALIDYLSTNFPPDKPAETPARVTKAK